MLKWKSVVTLAALILIVPGRSSAQESSSGFGAAAGLLLPGTVSADGFDLDSETSLLLRLTFDSFRSKTLGFGVFMNYSNVGVEGETGSMVTLGVAIKPRWVLGASQDQFLDVGLNIGYRTVSSDAFSDTVEGLAINLSVEYMKPLSEDRDLIFDFGFITQPSGGNEDVDVTWAPIFYLTGGISF